MTKKFRIWDTETKTFLQELAPYYWHVPRSLGNFDEEIFGEANLHDFSSILNNRGFEIQQWTGLIDSQGMEIYEGDILEFLGPEDFSAHYGKVFFEDGMFKATKHGTLFSWRKWITVVGNIFQNPELLEKC